MPSKGLRSFADKLAAELRVLAMEGGKKAFKDRQNKYGY
jgi:hypothetical protein